MSRVAYMCQNTIVNAAGNIAKYVRTNIPPPTLVVSGKILKYFLYLFLSSSSMALYPVPRTIDRSVFKPIVQISVIQRSESSNCHLLAITHAGQTPRPLPASLPIQRLSEIFAEEFIDSGIHHSLCSRRRRAPLLLHRSLCTPSP